MSAKWPEVIAKLQQCINDMHYNHWKKRQNIISEQITVLRVQESLLVPLILQLQQIPVVEKLVAEASMYPWSSDYLYRQKNPPSWINTHKMLKQLSNASRNQLAYYERAILKLVDPMFDLQQGTDEQYAVLGKAGFVDRLQAQQRRQEENNKKTDLQPVYQSALAYIAQLHTVTEAQIEDKNSRQFYLLMPLVVWLVRQTRPEKSQLAHLIGLDVAQLEHFERSVPAQHSAAVLNKIKMRWVAPIVMPTQKDNTSSSNTNDDNPPTQIEDTELVATQTANKDSVDTNDTDTELNSN